MTKRKLPKKPRLLTVRQNNFIAEYLVDQNGAEAARRAGYKGSAKTLSQVAYENLSRPELRAHIDEALKRRAERVEVKPDDVLRELLRIAFADPADALDAKGRMLPLQKMPLALRRAVAGFEIDHRGRPVKLKFWNKNHAVETTMKHLGMLVERKRVEVTLTLEQLVQESMKLPVDGLARRVTVAGSDSVPRAADALPESTTEPEPK